MKKLFSCALSFLSVSIITGAAHASGTPGTNKWMIQLNAPIVASPTLSDDGSILYVGTVNDELVALNTSDGSERWHYTFTGGIFSSPVYDSETDIVYVTTNAIQASEIGGIYALDAKTGLLIKALRIAGPSCQFGRPIRTTYLPSGVTHKPVAYSSYCVTNNKEYASISEFSAFSDFDPSVTYEVLPYDVSRLDFYRKKEIIFDHNPETAYSYLEGIITPSYGTIPNITKQALGPAIGDWNISQTCPFASDARFWQSTIIPNVSFSNPVYDPNYQLVYVGGSDGNFYAYDPRGQGLNVAPVFTLHLSGNLALNPPAIGFPGGGPASVYVTSDDGYLYAVNIIPSANNTKSGTATVRWKIRLSNEGFASQPAIDGVTGGTPLIYVVDKVGTVYAILDMGTIPVLEPWSPLVAATHISSTPITGYDGGNHLIYSTSNASTGAVYATYGPVG